MTQLGIGLIGTGFMGKCHALAWNAVRPTFGGDLPRPKLAVVCAGAEAEAEAAAAAFDIGRWTLDWREVVADPAVAAVSIAAPNHLHCEIALAALAAGKHVWCEKPMAISLADAEAMAAAAATAPGRTIIGYNYVQNPLLQQARRLIREGSIGRVTQFRCCMDEDFMAEAATPWGLKDDRRSGYGVLDDFGSHMVGLAHFLVGEIAEVAAVCDRPFASRPVAAGSAEVREVETHDIASALLRFASGVTGSLAASRAAWGRKSGLCFEVHGDRGTIRFDQERPNEIHLFVAGEDPETGGFRRILAGPQHPPYDAFCPASGHGLGFNDLKAIEARHFLRVIAGEEPAVFDFAEGVKVERVVHALARSAAERRWIEVAGA